MKSFKTILNKTNNKELRKIALRGFEIGKQKAITEYIKQGIKGELENERFIL